MVRLYGSKQSTSARCLWALEELGLPYEHVPLDVRKGETRAQWYLDINPNGRVPTLVDGDTTLFESMAINLYLARKYDGSLKPASDSEWDHAIMWSFWAANELEILVRQLVRNRLFLDEAERDSQAAQRAESLLASPLDVLDAHLDDHAYILGNRFSIADINVAHGALWLPVAGTDLTNWPNVSGWIEECRNRPALLRLHAGHLTVERSDQIPAGTPDPRGGTLD